MTFFDAYKEYLILNSKNEYIPTSAKFDVKSLVDAMGMVDQKVYPMTPMDEEAVYDFAEASKALNMMHIDMYAHIKKILPSLNMQGKNVCEYFVGIVNRNSHIIAKKHNENLKAIDTKSFPVMDLTEFRFEQDNKELTPLPIRSNLEMDADITCLILNYIRYFLNNQLEQPGVSENQFAGRLLSIDNLANIGLLFRQMYNHALYEGAKISRLDEGSKILFSYEDEEKECLIKAGKILLENQQLAVYNKYSHENPNSRFNSLLNTYRIKSYKVSQGFLKLSFGQGRIKELNNTLKEIDAALMAYYPFLDITQKLPRLDDVSIEDVLVVYGTMQYIARYVIANGHFDLGLYKRSDFDVVPSKILKTDLIDYLGKLVNLNKKKIVQCVKLFEAEWDKYNNIWDRPIYPIDSYELIPLYPMAFTMIFYVIDRILEKGGIPLDSRGTLFEKYIHEQISKMSFKYERNCLPARLYGKKGDEEEIDVLVKLKHVLLVGEAKCIQYPIEPINYHDAWKRLKEGIEQIREKVSFVKNHPEYFKELGDYSDKEVIPFVVTNYPLYTGCSYNGIYITNASSFLSYLRGEHVLTQREFGSMNGMAIPLRYLYTNEDEYSYNFKQFLRNNPQKELFLKYIKMEECVVYKDEDSQWVSRDAMYMNDSRFNISNRK